MQCWQAKTSVNRGALDFFGFLQCFQDFPSPEHMFGIYFRLVLVIFCYKRGGEKCKIDMSGYQTMHICDVLKPSANVWNISG